MKRLDLLGWCLSLALFTPIASHADVLVDNSPPDHVNGWGSDSSFTQFAANPFTLSTSATINGFNFWGDYVIGGPTSPFVVNFFTDSSGQPGSLLATASATLTGAATGGTTLGRPEYKYQLSLTQFSLLAGNYWVSVYDSSSSEQFAWLTSAQNGSWDFSHGSPTTGPWGSLPNTLTFQVLGNGISAVPEGGASSGFLLCVGLASLVALKSTGRRDEASTR